MPVLRSTLDPGTAAYTQNRAATLAALERIRPATETMLAAGGEKYVRRHRERGKLLARERVELLLDADAPFLELSPLAGAHDPAETPGAGLITGIGVVSGVECLITANEPTVKGGALGPASVAKQLRALEIAARNRLPVVSLVESAGADLPRQADIFVPGGRAFRDLTRLSAAGIPTVALVFGSSTAGGAYVPGMSEYTVFVEDAAAVLPRRAAAGEDGDRRGHGRRDARRRRHARPGVRASPTTSPPTSTTRCGWAARSSPTCGWRKLGPGPVAARRTQPRSRRRGTAGLRAAGPQDAGRGTRDPRPGPRRLPVLRVQAAVRHHAGHRLGLDRTGSRVGVLANNGILFSEEASKGAQFIQLANARGLPLLFVQNITGFMVGTAVRAGRDHQGRREAHQRRLQLRGPAPDPHGRRLLRRRQLRDVRPGLRPRFVFTWPNHRIAVMGGKQLAGVMSIISQQKAERAGRPYDDEADADDARRRRGDDRRRSPARCTPPAACGTTASSTRATPGPCSASPCPRPTPRRWTAPARYAPFRM